MLVDSRNEDLRPTPPVDVNLSAFTYTSHTERTVEAINPRIEGSRKAMRRAGSERLESFDDAAPLCPSFLIVLRLRLPWLPRVRTAHRSSSALSRPSERARYYLDAVFSGP